MFIEDTKKDFYMKLIGQRLLLLVNHDIDAICACRILHSLFRSDNIIYTLVPIKGINDLETAYHDNANKVKFVVLINCGGNIDIIETLEPERDVQFFIIDSHRPFDVCNVYNGDQVLLVSKDTEDVPEYDQLFQAEENEDEDDEGGDDDDDDGETQEAKRRRLGEEEIMKRREKRQWAETRNRIMFEYTQFSFYGRSSAMEMFELAWKLSKDNIEMLWWAIVGVTEQTILGKVENQHYLLETANLQNHVSRLNQFEESDETPTPTAQGIKITFNKDLLLALYRHWTVASSLRYSMYSSCKLKLWTLKGEKRVQELLAEIGLPLIQSKQKFASMDLVLRQEFLSKIEKLGEKYNMDQIVFASFTLQHGYRNKFCAADIVYAMLAHLESSTKEKSPSDCFMDALDCLTRTKKNSIEEGIEKAKRMLMCIFRQVQSLLDMGQVILAGPFMYVVLQEGSLDVLTVSHPHKLILLAQFTLQAYVAGSRSKRSATLPLVASAPLSVEDGTCLVVGVPPVSEDSPKNFFGKAFEKAADIIKARITMDYFDTSVIQLKIEDRPKFFDALTSLLS